MAEAEAWVMIPKVKNKGTECVLDMRPIVLCKDCKHGTEMPRGIYCDIVMVNRTAYRDPVWFCADGVKKDD